ncbi:MAG: SH3 domain-containing protein [Acidimicrobiia bacterium]|nr:SH3 domain-containing protein [Acidimicrobiia bacterium]
MSIEERLRDAFAQRTEGVEVSPGALFEIQRRAGHRRRMPEVRLRPALVLAAAACAAIAVAISVSVTGPSTAPLIETETPPVAGTADEAAVTPTTAEPPPTTPQSPTPAPPAVAPLDPQPSGAGQITTSPEPTPPVPPTPPAPVTPAPPPDPAPATDIAPESDTAAVEALAVEIPACPEEPESDGNDSMSERVTVYFACGESDAAPRQRAAAANNLPTALGILLGGPSEADSTAGFQGLSGNTATTVTTMTSNRWLTIDLPAGLADAFGGDDDITAEQFLTQLNATVFQFSDFEVAEYRLDGDCAAFGALAGGSCQIHIRDGAGYASQTSELTAHTIGDVSAVIRAEPDDGAEELGVLEDGSRLTDGRYGGGSDAWAEVVTTVGEVGWVSAQTIVAQPLSIDSTTRAAMENLARRLTTGPGLESSALLPAGLVLRWGADASDVTVVSTAGAAASSDWWSTPVDTPSPRDGSATSSLADLLWIDGSGDGATVRVNTPGPLGEPHGDFDSLAYVSIYRSAIRSSVLPPPIPTTTTTTTTTQATTGEGSDLPPALPTPAEETDDGDEQPASPRAQVSAIFDFLSPDGPRVAAVEAIWIQP